MTEINSNIPLSIVGANVDFGDAYEKASKASYYQEEAKKNQLENVKSKLGLMGSIVENVRDQDTLNKALETGKIWGLVTPEIEQQYRQYDPIKIDQLKGLVKDAHNKFDLQAQELQYKMGGGAAGALADRWNNDPIFRQGFNATKLTSQGYTQTDADGNPIMSPTYVEGKGNLKKSEAFGTTTGNSLVERSKEKTKVESALNAFENQSKIVTDNISKAKDLINGWSTGYGSYLSVFPDSDASKLKDYLDTIKANVGFDNLAEMRENSKTGGALGNVSDYENKLNQAVKGALNAKNPSVLKPNLDTIEKLYPIVLKEKKRAFEQDYGNVTPFGNNPKKTNLGVPSELPDSGKVGRKPTPAEALAILKARGAL